MTQTIDERDFFYKHIPTEKPSRDFFPGPTIVVDIDQKLNGTNHLVDPSLSVGRDEDLAKVEVAVLACVFVFALVGNIVVLVRITYLARHKRMSRMNELIVHLCCADLFLTFFNVLPQLIWDITDQFHGGNVLCKFVKYVQVVAMYSSSYVLLITVIDRYIAICRPFLASLWTSDRTQGLIVAAWAVSFIFSTPQLFIFSYRVKNGVSSCWDKFTPGWTFQAYVTWFTFAIYVIPALIITCLYSRVLLAVRHSVRSGETILRRVSRFPVRRYCRSQRRSGLQSLSTSTDTSTKLDVTEPVVKRKNSRKGGARKYQQLSKATVKTTRFTLTVIFSYLVCWGPFFFSMLWRSWDKSAPAEGLSTTPHVHLVISEQFICYYLDATEILPLNGNLTRTEVK